MTRARKTIDDISSLKRNKFAAKGKLDSAKSRDEIPAGTSTGLATAEGQGSSSGIAFPLTELADSRTYYAERYVTSTDGIFQIAVKPIKSTKYKDNSGSQGQVNYIDPN